MPSSFGDPKGEFLFPSLCQAAHMEHLVRQPRAGLQSQGRGVHRSLSLWQHMVPHRDHRLQCPVSRGSACGHRISGSHVGETGGCETHLLACITLLLIVSSSHTCGAQIDTHMPFQSTLQSLISVSLDWNPDATGPQSQGSQCVIASVPPEFRFGSPVHPRECCYNRGLCQMHSS